MNTSYNFQDRIKDLNEQADAIMADEKFVSETVGEKKTIINERYLQ